MLAGTHIDDVVDCVQTTLDGDDDTEGALQIDEGPGEPDSDYERPSKKKKRGKREKKKEDGRKEEGDTVGRKHIQVYSNIC